MKNLLLTVLLLQTINVFAQEATGLFEDNYTTSTGMLINPAAPFADPNTWEVNIVSLGVFLDNNYIYYNHQTAFSLINYFQSNYHNGEDISFFNPSTIHLNSEDFIQGPSAYYYKNGLCIGLFTDERAGASIESNSVPQNLYNLFTVPYNRVITIPATHAAYMNWAELGVSGAMLVKDNTTGKLYLGVDIKLLGGLTAGKYSNNQPFSFERRSSDSTVATTPVNMTYSYAQSAGGSAASSFLDFNGGGVGTDIGAIYIIGDRVSCDELYDWKFGASVNDIGAITFKRRSSDYELTSSQGKVFSDTALAHTINVNNLDQSLSEIVYDNTTASSSGNTFTIWLPMSVTLQADKSLGNGFYVEASVIHRVPITYSMIYSPNMEAIAPRYESKWFTIVLPLILYNQDDFHLGLSLRAGPLTIGSDDLASLFIPGKFAGSDVYMGLRVFPLKSDCKKPKVVKNSDKLKECPPQPIQ